MKSKSWLRKNWLLVAGISFVGLHIGTYIIQKVAKTSARSGSELKQQKDYDE
ncbi:uncharacterized protein [Ambystoma mexicanum]|uniref:uncharacterized protein n=1 Tax=Ambystoma mexicanum TaxID=8296 RepID=UPI0037E76B15